MFVGSVSTQLIRNALKSLQIIFYCVQVNRKTHATSRRENMRERERERERDRERQRETETETERERETERETETETDR